MTGAAPAAARGGSGRFSLRRKLVAPLLWLWVVSALLAALAAFWLTGRSAQVAFDRVLKDDALALGSQVRWEGDGPHFLADSKVASSLVYDSFAPSHFLVRSSAGYLLAGNADLQMPPAVENSTLAREPVFYDSNSPWGRLRMVAVQMRHPLFPQAVWIVVGESLLKRQQLTEELAKAIFLPAAVLGFVIVPLILVGVRRGLAPAQAVAEGIERRGIDDLSPLPLANVPDELRGMVEGFNGLLARLEEAVVHERSFISDAAHQLRTPVAGIKLLVEDLRRVQRADPRQPPDAEVLEALHSSAGRITRLVHQLLTLARNTAPRAEPPQAVELRALLARVAAHWAAAAAAAGKVLEAPAASDAPAWAAAHPVLLEEALANLVDNALRYGGHGVRLGLAAGQAGVGWSIRVDDDGPRLDEATRSQMLSPFWRGDDSATEGSGLGLPIAQKALRQMGGELLLPEPPEGVGTRVELRLQLAATPA